MLLDGQLNHWILCCPPLTVSCLSHAQNRKISEMLRNLVIFMLPFWQPEHFVALCGFLWVVATFNHVGGSFNLFMATTGDVWISHLFEFGIICCTLSTFHVSSWIMANWRKTLPENTIPIFRLVLHNFDIPGCFLIFFSIAIFSPYFLLVGLLLQSVALFQSRKLVKYLE